MKPWPSRFPSKVAQRACELRFLRQHWLLANRMPYINAYLCVIYAPGPIAYAGFRATLPKDWLNLS